MHSKTKTIVPIIALILVTLVGRYVYYKFLNSNDRSDRPWAYEDANGNSLTGDWEGEVRDADGELHQLHLTIINPHDDASRAERATNRKMKRDRSKKTSFYFTAKETYQEKVILYENNGSLTDPEGNKVKWQFLPVDDKHYNGFNLNQAKGKWDADKLLMEVSFSYYTKEGHSHYESGDKRYSYVGDMVLKKVK
jgi:hypothetical protein